MSENGDIITVRMRQHQGPNANGVYWCEFVNEKGRVVKPKGMETQDIVAVPPAAIVNTSERERRDCLSG